MATMPCLRGTSWKCASRGLPLAVLVLIGAGCGYGSAALGLSAGGGGGGNAPTTVSTLTVTQPKVPPATIGFTLVDAEGDEATVEWFYVAPDDPTATAVALAGLPANPLVRSASAAGLSAALSWQFGAEADLGAHFQSGVKLIARVEGGASTEVTVDLGNDPPAVRAVEPGPQPPPATEMRGIARLRLALQDPNDRVDVRVEFFDEDDPAAGWRLARRAGASQEEPLGIRGIGPPGAEAEVDFFWDTDFDLENLERRVRVRYTPIEEDGVATGAPVETGVFTVDNNDEPVVQVGEGPFLLSPDSGRGLVVPYTVVDEESDLVRVLFQWRPENESDFVDLGSDEPEQLLVWLEDPQYVRDKRICTPFPSYASGYAHPIDARSVRLPELRTHESRALVGHGGEGLDLVLLRPSTLASIAPTWSRNPLRAPVTAVPLGRGDDVLVLDRDDAGTARLLEIGLTSGDELRGVAAGMPGDPSAMVLTPDAASALVATDVGGTWMLQRVDLTTGVVTPLLSAATCPAPCPAGPLRAVLPLGSGVALATAEDAVWRLDWLDPASPRAARLVSGLATPWGLVRDPLRPGRILVAERDAPVGRVVSVDLATGAVEPLAVRAPTGEPVAFPRPRALTVSPDGAELIVLCEPTGHTGLQLRGARLGHAGQGAFVLGDVPAGAAGVAAGPDGLRLVATPDAADLAVRGGVEQTRALKAYDPATGIATAVEAFDPAVRPQQTWRIALGRSFRDPVRGSPNGSGGRFLWDSRAAWDHGRVFLRAVCFDTEKGTDAQTGSPRPAMSRFTSLLLPESLAGALANPDLDGDGDLDFVSTGSGNGVSVHYQNAPDDWEAPVPVPGIESPFVVVAADVDRDGDLDLVAANDFRQDVQVYIQDPAGSFTASPALEATGWVTDLAVADLDGDGWPDLIATSNERHPSVWYQDETGSFARRTIGGGGFASGLAVGDLDGDGDLDLAVRLDPARAMRVLTQESPRQFSRGPNLPTGASSGFGLVASDFDADGDLDLLCPNFNTGAGGLTWYLQDAPGSFTRQPDLEVERPFLVIAADFDADGDNDVLAYGGIAGLRSTLFFQEAPGVFSPTRLEVLDRPLGAGDMDGDGDLDLLGSELGRVTIMHQDRRRSFEQQEGPRIVGTGVGFYTTATDLDGDGDMDLVLAESTASVKVAYQDGPRDFAQQQDLGLRAEHVVAADLDADGDQDLVAVWGNGLTMLYQDGPRTFTTLPTVGAAMFPRAGAVADLDQDGDLDAVAVGEYGEVVIFLQVGPRTFVPQPPVLITQGPADVEAADLDGDGDEDIVVANREGNDVTVLMQGAPGSFTLHATLPVAGRAVDVDVADLDADGDLDLVVASGVLTFWYQEAPGAFTRNEVLEVNSGATSVGVLDLDGDGDLDLVTAVLGISDEVSVVYQDGPGNFTVQAPVFVGRAQRAQAVDLDGDGDPDLMVADRGGVTWFWGRH
ncbi:MAG: VCBS repeat-containing protein [Planctomycetota bacterium]